MSKVTNNSKQEFIGQIIDGFEDFLTDRNIKLKNSERDEAISNGEDPNEVAIIYGSDYGELQTYLEDTLRNWEITDSFESEISEKYEIEDFTGHIGVLLDDNAEEENKHAAMKFLQDIYNIAVKHL